MPCECLTILGSTGSIGVQTLEVVRSLKPRIRIAGLSAGGRNPELLAEQTAEFHPDYVHIADESRAQELRSLLPSVWKGRLLTGKEGLCEIAREAPADLVMAATVGWTGVEPVLEAIGARRNIALANKEVLVCAGDLITRAAQEKAVQLLPVDSEHNAIFQCLAAGRIEDVRRIILTCSGGPFRTAGREEILRAGPGETLNHPTWDMGAKITVDSATLMNKGFEVIEAHHLFQIPYNRIEVVVHPQSTVHSLVEFVDGSMIAQLGPTDMKLPIQHVLTHPERRPAMAEPFSLAKAGTLTFEEPDLIRFPNLRLAYDAGKRGGGAPCILNASNEIAVEAHLAGKITCGEVALVNGAVMAKVEPVENPGLEELRTLDQRGRECAKETIGNLLRKSCAS